MVKKYTTVSIPKPLYELVKAHVAKTGFTSVSDFVTFTLREIVSGDAQRTAGGKTKLSKGDMERVRERLRALGYL
ncbi:MAG: ribbon-helix-helix domain-containing protein [Candidatus Norongarragalinales archaeon]